MDKNIFLNQIEFIEFDPRKTRTKGAGYQVTPEFMFARHAALFPPALIRGKRILDLGSCLAATGAWCLSNGASFYKGIEIDNEFVENSKLCLSKYYSSTLWSIEKVSIEEFFSDKKDKFDILVASGVIYGSDNPLAMLTSFAESAEFIIIESMQTQTVFHSRILCRETLDALAKDPRIVEFMDTEAYIAVGQRGMVTSGDQSIRFAGFNPSMGAIKFIMSQLGYAFSDKPNRQLRNSLPEQYAPDKRFALYFKKDLEAKKRNFGLKSAVEDSRNILNIHKW